MGKILNNNQNQNYELYINNRPKNQKDENFEDMEEV